MLADTLSRAGQTISRTGSVLFSPRRQDERQGDDDDHESGRAEGARGRQKAKGLAGGNKAIAAFVLSLFAFTIQTEAAQHVQQALGYRKPFLSLYLGHSSFVLLFPLYMAFLRLAQPGIPLSHQLHLISLNMHWQLSAPTASLPKPAADSIRRRLSTLSMRTESSMDEGEAEDFDIEQLQRRRTKAPPPRKTWSERRFGFHVGRLLGVFAVLTIGITVPALSWYSAVPLTTMADITTIYNTYAVWALVFSIWFLGEQWEKRKVFSVLLACGGVVLVAYGGAEHRRRPREPETPTHQLTIRAVEAAIDWITTRDEGSSSGGGSNAFLGDMLAFLGAVTMAAYEMAFKVIGTLPDEEAQRERYCDRHGRERSYVDLDADSMRDEAEAATLLGDDGEDGPAPARGDQTADNNEAGTSSDAQDATGEDKYGAAQSTERTAIWKTLDGEGPNGRTASPSYQSMTPPVEQNDSIEEPENKRPSILAASQEAARRRRSWDGQDKILEEWIPPPLPFGLHPIIITSGIGLVTLCTLWIGLPIANALGWEPFELPLNVKTYFYLFIVAFSGIIFNGCFSILLALWGPVLASVSCLLTTVLVFAADILLGHDFRWISLLGCFSIVAGFGVLVSGGDIH